MPKIISFLWRAFVAYVVVMVGYGLYKEAQNSHATGDDSGSARNQQTLDGHIAEVARQANLVAPTMVDADTRVDSANAEGHRLTYHLTVLHIANRINGAAFDQKIRPQVLRSTCENSKDLLAKGALLIMEYRADDGRRLGQVLVNQDLCTSAE